MGAGDLSYAGVAVLLVALKFRFGRYAYFAGTLFSLSSVSSSLALGDAEDKTGEYATVPLFIPANWLAAVSPGDL